MATATLTKPIPDSHHWSAGQHRLFDEADMEAQDAARFLDEILIDLCETKEAIGYSPVKPHVDCGAFERGPFRPYVEVQLNIRDLKIDQSLPAQSVRHELAKRLRELAADIERV